MPLSRYVMSVPPRARLCMVCSIVLLLAFPASAAPNADFIRGYVTAYFQFSAPKPAIQVLEVAEDGSVVLASDECLTEVFRNKARNELISEGPATEVEWRVNDACPEAVQPVIEEKEEKVITQRLPLRKLFTSPLADPRAARSSIRYERYDSPRDSFNAGAVSAGETFPLATFTFSDAKELQISIEGAIFSLFDLDGDSHDLINSDFIIGLPISYRSNSWSFRLRPYHQSSHLGDELLLNNPEINRINLSYEDLELLASYDWEVLRFYGGGSVILSSQPDLDPFRVQGGIEFRLPELIWDADLVLAGDIQSRQEVSWRVDQSYILGLAFKPEISMGERELRVVTEYYDGSSPNGQFFEDQIRYWGLGIQLDL